MIQLLLGNGKNYYCPFEKQINTSVEYQKPGLFLYAFLNILLVPFQCWEPRWQLPWV